MKYTRSFSLYHKNAPLALSGFSFVYLELDFEEASVGLINRQIQCPRVF